MLKRLISHGQSSSSSKRSSQPSTSRKISLSDLNLGNPTMQLSLSRIAKGDSAGLMSAVAKATVDECGQSNVASSFSVQRVFVCWKGSHIDL